MTLLRRALLFAVIAMFAPGVSACAGPGPEKLIEEIAELSNEQADILNSVNTLEDVEKAKPELMRVMKKARALSQKLEPYKDRLENDEKLKAKVGAKMEDAQRRIQKAFEGIEARLDEETKRALYAAMQEAAG